MRQVELKNKIQDKLKVVYRQYEFEEENHPYTTGLKECEKELFSNDSSLYSEARRQIEGLICNSRAWDHLDSGPYEDRSDEFIDNYKNLDEFFEFTETILDDIDEYIKMEEKNARV